MLALIVLTLSVCGALASPIDNEKQSRIIGGQVATYGQFPYQASLRFNNNGTHFCGGSIIDGFWILTAAHCVVHVMPNQINVIVGTNFLNSGGRAYGVSSIHSHASFNPANNINDIAVLRLTSRISAASNVNTISLASSVTPSGVRGILSGWGITEYPSSKFSNDLQYIYLQTITVNQCQNLLPFTAIFDSNVCTNMPNGLGACRGDSGGPLVLNGVQHGILSWGIPCAQAKPDIFTSIPFYRNWIRSVTGV